MLIGASTSSIGPLMVLLLAGLSLHSLPLTPNISGRQSPDSTSYRSLTLIATKKRQHAQEAVLTGFWC